MSIMSLVSWAGSRVALAVAYHAIIVPPREDLCTVGSEMGHIGLRPGDSYTGRPQLCNHSGGLLLVRANAYTQARALRGLGGSGVKRPAPDDFEPRTFLNLYKIAHSELMVDKWNNFAFGLCRSQSNASQSSNDVVLLGGQPERSLDRTRCRLSICFCERRIFVEHLQTERPGSRSS
jgi:hypothetical protein